MFYQTPNFRNVLAVTVCVLTLCACNSSDPAKGAAPAVKETVAATVNGITISEQRVALMTKQHTSHGQPENAEMRKSVIDQLAMQMIISQEAVKKGMEKTPEVLDQIELTRQAILANVFVQDYMKNNPVGDAMLAAEYDKVKEKMGGNEYKARHILVEKEADAREVVARLKKDIKAFASLAKEKSKDPGSKGNGGDLGWFDPHSMVPEFGAAVAKLEKGKFTDEPVKSQFGYHVIFLDDSRAKQVPPLEQIKPALIQQVQQQNLRKFLDDMKAKAKIEIAAVAAIMPVLAPAPAVGAAKEAPAAPAIKK